MKEVFYTYCLFVKAQKMAYEIKQIGHINGDKWMNGVIPNMKVGEIRFYPQDNPNLYRTQSRELSPKTVTRIFKSMFPDYEVEVNESDISLIDHIVKRESRHYIINKAYICIKEATPEHDGTVINLHNGYVLVFKEKYLSPID
jgi:uncharacterized protein YlzI (FlbEa/FlbD family)